VSKLSVALYLVLYEVNQVIYKVIKVDCEVMYYNNHSLLLTVVDK